MSFRIDSMTTVKPIAIGFSNSLDPDQTRQRVWLALGLKYHEKILFCSLRVSDGDNQAVWRLIRLDKSRALSRSKLFNKKIRVK